MKTDIEQIVGKLADYFKAQLETKLTEIAADKGDGLVVPVPNALSAYFIQTLNESVANFDPYVYIGIIDKIASDSLRLGSAQDIPIEVAIVIADAGTDANMWKKLFRYQRALKEIFELGWNKNAVGPTGTLDSYILSLPELGRHQVGIQIHIQLT